VLLTLYQVEFPKTHELDRLLTLVGTANSEVADALTETKWLGPFAVDIRYPGDAAEMLPGDEVKAIGLARLAQRVVRRILAEDGFTE
jgi:HEPN domain-containing protein